MIKFSIIVPSDSAIDRFLSHQPVAYRITDLTPSSVVFSYFGLIPPLVKISQLLEKFDPSDYTIRKSTTGISLIVHSL